MFWSNPFFELTLGGSFVFLGLVRSYIGHRAGDVVKKVIIFWLDFLEHVDGLEGKKIFRVTSSGFEAVPMIKVKLGKGTIGLIEGDLTKQGTDAIVNAANSGLMGGGGVDGSIHAAGGPRILEECVQIVKKIGRLPPGQVVITTAGDMPSKFVIHTVGPIWRGGTKGEDLILASCYTNSLKLAREKGLHSVSFPSISTGAYGYPLDLAAQVALKAVKEFLEGNDGIEEVFFVLWGKDSFDAYDKALRALLKPKKARDIG